MEVRMIVAGSRNFDDYKLLKEKVSAKISSYDTTKTPVRIISGTARGADQLGANFAKRENCELSEFLAAWGLYGKSAGYRRNVEMAQFAVANGNIGVLVAFWDGKSKGTKHMIDVAKRYALDVEVIMYAHGE